MCMVAEVVVFRRSEQRWVPDRFFEQKILNTSYPEKVANSCKLSLLPFRSGAQTYLSLGDEAPSTTVTFAFSLQHFLIRLVCLTIEMGKMFEEI
jgi:hypothetical protein